MQVAGRGIRYRTKTNIYLESHPHTDIHIHIITVLDGAIFGINIYRSDVADFSWIQENVFLSFQKYQKYKKPCHTYEIQSLI